jgi:hypothetical protein
VNEFETTKDLNRRRREERRSVRRERNANTF